MLRFAMFNFVAIFGSVILKLQVADHSSQCTLLMADRFSYHAQQSMPRKAENTTLGLDHLNPELLPAPQLLSPCLALAIKMAQRSDNIICYHHSGSASCSPHQESFIDSFNRQEIVPADTSDADARLTSTLYSKKLYQCVEGWLALEHACSEGCQSHGSTHVRVHRR